MSGGRPRRLGVTGPSKPADLPRNRWGRLGSMSASARFSLLSSSLFFFTSVGRTESPEPALLAVVLSGVRCNVGRSGSDAGLESELEFDVSPVLEASPPLWSVGPLEFDACVEPPELDACVEFVLEPLLLEFLFELSPELLAEASPPLWSVGRSGSGGGALGSGPESLPDPFDELPEELPPLPEFASPG